MIAVIFEVEPADGHVSTFLDTATHLKPILEQIEGFISVERFESLVQPGRYLSLSFFEDEAAVIRLRNTEAHRRAQSIGRARGFLARSAAGGQRDTRLRPA